jgi:hypothetical protein
MDRRGRWERVERRPSVEGSLALDIRQLRREGRLAPGANFSWSCALEGAGYSALRGAVAGEAVLLIYQHRLPGGRWENVRQPVVVEWLPCHYGGQGRPFWRCPECDARVAILYGAGGRRIMCRQCAGLAYPSQNEDPQARARRRLEKILVRLQGSPEGPLPERPKWMRPSTFDRARVEAEAARRQAGLPEPV